MIDQQPESGHPAKNAGADSEEVDPNQLTPEEQMERYEEQLKNDDWGHQPC